MVLHVVPRCLSNAARGRKRYLRATTPRLWFASPEGRRESWRNKEDGMRKFLLASVARWERED